MLLIKLCFLSLLDALEGCNFRIVVLGDKLSDEMISFFKHFDVELQLGNFGNDVSFKEALKIARSIPDNEWVYFCEDDYLHVPNAFKRIDTFLNERETYLTPKKKDLFIFPPDYPDRYKPKYLKKSLLLVTSDCHWRQVSNVTFTFLTKSSTLKKHYALFKKASVKVREGSLGNGDRYISRKLFGRLGLWSGAICFSPVPGLSTHMHRDTMTPLVDWEQLLQKYKTRLEALNS